MTNDPVTLDESYPPPDVVQQYDGRAGLLLLIAFASGVLRGVVIVATGSGWFTPLVEAAYALLLHSGVGLLASITVQTLGGWLHLAGRRATASTPVVAPAEAPPLGTKTPDAPSAGTPRRVRHDDPARWRDRILAARQADDPAGVLELREGAPEGLDEPTLAALDAELGKWLLGMIHHRLRSGPLRPDLVELVERGSEAFGHTKEGASLRAALPTLRRGAGLCPRCAGPYTGVWEACPACMGRPEPPPPILPGLVAVDEDEYEPPPAAGRWFVDPDDEAPDGGRGGG
jgi:hypothetical protein